MEFGASSFLMILTAFFFSLSFLFLFVLLRSFRCCGCEVCSAYLTSSWADDFDNLSDWYSHLLNKSPTRTIQLHVLNSTITANPRSVEYILKTKFHNFPKGKPFSAILGDFLGRGIFNVDGETWRFQKKMASLELDSVSIRSYAFDIIHDEIEHRLVPLLAKSASEGDSGALDMQDVFRRFSFDTICKFSFGLDPKCLELSLPISDFAVAFDWASKLSAERAMSVWPVTWKIKRLLNIGTEKRLREAIKVIDMLAKEVIRQRDEMGFSSCRDLLSRFMRSVNDETFLRDIVISFLLAGRDSVASGLTSLIWLIINNPGVASRIREEADLALGRNRGPGNFSQMRGLRYLKAVVYESMRLYPPIQFDSKFCLKGDILPDGSAVKPGTRVTYHPYAMGRNVDIWGSDSLEFKPERWLSRDSDGVLLSVSPFKYPVFQGGVRVCLGREMALLELQSVLLSLVRRFDFEQATANHAKAPRFSPGLTATFSGGLHVMVRPRPCSF